MLFSTKYRSFHNLIFFCPNNNKIFINIHRNLNTKPGCLNVKRLDSPHHAHFTHRALKPDTTCDFNHNRFSWYLSNGHTTNEISLQLTHCIVSSEANLETWWWPSARAETCSLSNKYYTTLLVVFRLSTLYHLIELIELAYVILLFLLDLPSCSAHLTLSRRCRSPCESQGTLLIGEWWCCGTKNE
jgi:hypothetical protein